MLPPPPLTRMYSRCALPAYWIAVARTPSPWHKTTSLCSLCICSFLPQQHCLSRASSSISWEIFLHNSLFCNQCFPNLSYATYCPILPLYNINNRIWFFPSSWELHWLGKRTTYIWWHKGMSFFLHSCSLKGNAWNNSSVSRFRSCALMGKFSLSSKYEGLKVSYPSLLKARYSDPAKEVHALAAI